MIPETAMEYTDGLMEVYITENTNRKIKMVKDTLGGQVAMNISENSRIICNGERESNKKTDNYTEFNMIKTSASAEAG